MVWEILRRVLRSRPACLVLLGRGEHSIYQIRNELTAAHPGPEILSVIGDVGDPGKMGFVFRSVHPDLVFHTAAYKHVSFVEENPEEGVRNNVFGLRNVARIALRHGVERFVLVSTDKAVEPTSVLGATKKLAELILRQMATQGETRFLAVRFGNVLRSRGSAVLRFEEQIARGGPVTVTHPEMRRYFMSIPEAAHLVLRSGAVAGSGELCVLDMGEPVRIVDLVEALIELQGRVPYEEVEIAFTGIGPGEKLEECLLSAAEAQQMRRVGKLMISRSEQGPVGVEDGRLEQLRRAVEQCRRAEIRSLLEEMVPGYVSSGAAPALGVGMGEL